MLAGITRVRNPAWWDLDVSSKAYTQMKAALHRGTFADLNIITTSLQNDLLGCGAVPALSPTPQALSPEEPARLWSYVGRELQARGYVLNP